jgi:Mor family transcriptional regulator
MFKKKTKECKNEVIIVIFNCQNLTELKKKFQISVHSLSRVAKNIEGF